MRERLWDEYSTQTADAAQAKAPFASKRMVGPVGAAAATGAVEITLPVAIVAAAYIIGQAMVDVGTK